MKKSELLKLIKSILKEEKKKGLDGKACWDGYKLQGTKMKGGKKVDNCIKIKEKKMGFRSPDYDDEAIDALKDFASVGEMLNQQLDKKEFSEDNPIVQKILTLLDEDTQGELQELTQQLLDLVSELPDKPDKPEKQKIGFRKDIDEIDMNISNLLEMEVIDENITEAKFKGKTVTLNKPTRGDSKKFKVYVNSGKKNADGSIKVKKVNFGHGGTTAKKAGQKTMSIRKSNPKARSAFRARHNCDNPGPKTMARYWSCKKW